MNIDFADAAIGLLPSLIITAAWITAVVFTIRMVRNGGRPEKLLLIGVCLMLAVSVISAAAPLLMPWIITNFAASGADQLSIVRIIGAAGIINALISLAGIILMVLAFWKKFKSSRPATASK